MESQTLHKNRLDTIAGHLKASNASTGKLEVKSSIPKRRQDLVKLDGWGYKDSAFIGDLDKEELSFTGNRYEIANKRLPYFRQWVIDEFNLQQEHRVYLDENFHKRRVESLPRRIVNEAFLNDLNELMQKTKVTMSADSEDLIFRSRGQSLHEIYMVRKGIFNRIPDLVVWPTCHQEVVDIIRLAAEHNVVLIPFGGGTSVSGALECPKNEKRMIVSLDTSQMNAIHWIDHQNLTAKIEAGIIGQDLDRELARYGLCCGHEPDSFEFSSLGGWIATRASGMKKNIYGNIEDIVVHIKMVTTNGVIERNCSVPRVSMGPDVQHFIMGSEGTLGVITEAVIKVKPLPECKKYGSLVFRDFVSGVSFMREIAKLRLKPASVRLMDNAQFKFGQALKPAEDNVWQIFKRSMEKFYLLKLKGFDQNQIAVATLLFEGSKEEVELIEKKVLDIGTKFGGIYGGEENGRRGYVLTFVIAYLRDLALDYGVVAESFETSVPWDRCLDLCRNVTNRMQQEIKKFHLSRDPFITYRVTQTYDSGACVYFYVAFIYADVAQRLDPIKALDEVETCARDEILANGGSLSHHHGVGKLRKAWLKESVSETGLALMKAIKQKADPTNVFANGNLMSDDS